MPEASPPGFDVCPHAVAAKCVRGARRVAPGGGKWVRANQSRSCCPRQPYALVSEVRTERPRSVYVRGGEESSYIPQVLCMHNTTCTLVCFQGAMHVDACVR